jgi:hypothetical protein
MKLTDFDKNPIENATRALKEHYNVPFNVRKMSYAQSRDMLNKVRGLMTETKKSTGFYESQQNSSYLKLVFMEQALSKHFAEISLRKPRIVVENEEVEKSQVVLAAQDMVDQIQKMVEEVSDMLVKELPALTDGVQSEIGVNESTTFNQQVSEALTSLQAALTQSQATLKSALGGITGQGGAEAFDAGGDMGGAADMGGDMGAELDVQEPLPGGGKEEMDIGIEAPEEEPLGGTGRPKR